MSKLIIERASEKPNTLGAIGSVENVVRGIVPETLKNRRFSASEMRYGFELGSPQGIRNMGECIAMNGLLYSSRTDATRKERDPLMWGPEFVTSGIFLVPNTCEPNLKISYCSLDKNLSIREIYKKIYKITGAPFAIAGCAELAQLRSQAITYSPVENESIFSNPKKYFCDEESVERDTSIALVGVVSDFSDAGNPVINEKLRTVLYYNPFNRQSAKLVSHSHAATLTNPILNTGEIHPHHVKSVVHLMDDSLVRYIKAEVFVIADIENYENKFPPS